jgi:hypothetical protein
LPGSWRRDKFHATPALNLIIQLGQLVDVGGRAI